SGLEALPSWKYADVQPTAAQQPAQPWYRGRGCASAPARASSVKRPVSMAGVCAAAMLLLVVPLFTLEADARGGFGGHGGGFGGARSFGVARFGGAGVGARSFGVARFGGAGVGRRSFSVARVGGPHIGGRAFAGRSFAGRSLASPRVATARLAGTGGRFTTA